MHSRRRPCAINMPRVRSDLAIGGDRTMREPERRKTLDGVALLKGLPPQEIRDLAKVCVWRDCKAHEQIFDRHHESHDIYFVVSGKVRIVNYSMSGREVSFDDIPAGGSFGELAA